MGAELIVGAVTAGVGAGMSFAQAKQQRVLAERAQTAAAKAMEEAKSQLQANYLEGLALPTAAYDAQREAISQQGADILAAVSQGEDRGAAAAAGADGRGGRWGVASAAAGGCAATSDTANIRVNVAPIATFTYVSSPHCSNA